MIILDLGDRKFSYRSAGIFIKNGNVLLHRAEADDYWTIPGGRVEIGEAAIDAVRREIKEELNIEVNRVTPAFVADNFFEMNGIQCHELGVYFWLQADDSAYIYSKEEFFGVEMDARLIFKWFPLSAINQIALYPIFMRKKLTDTFGELEYISNKETEHVNA